MVAEPGDKPSKSFSEIEAMLSFLTFLRPEVVGYAGGAPLDKTLSKLSVVFLRGTRTLSCLERRMPMPELDRENPVFVALGAWKSSIS